MERDYTTEVEEVLGLVQSDIQGDNYNFAPTDNGTGTTGVYNSWNTYNSSDTSYYTGLFGSVSRCFEAVRNFDAAYDGDPFNWCAGGGETIESFKNTISGIRDCMKLPSYDGDTVDSIKYKDTIFGDEYASLVASEGLEELMLKSDSAIATKYFFDQIITVNADGSVEYDMPLILEIMEKSGDDIHSGQYDAIALAYLYMNEEEMAQLMCVCTNISDDSIENYSKWVVDTEKQTNIYNRLLALSDGYLIMACSSLDSGDQDLGNGYIKTRKEVIQKMALWDAFGNVDGYWVEYPNEGPGISIDANAYKNDRVSYVLNFSEFRKGDTFINFANSTVTVDPCMEDSEMQLYQAKVVEDGLTNHFVPGFTSEGCNDMGRFVVQHTLNYIENMTVNVAFNQIPDGYGYAYTTIQSIYGAVNDYNAGIEGATMIENSFDNVYVTILYNEFDFCSTPVKYDTADKCGCIQYVQPGVDSVSQIEEFNNNTGEAISIYGMMYYSEGCANSIMDYFGIQ